MNQLILDWNFENTCVVCLRTTSDKDCSLFCHISENNEYDTQCRDYFCINCISYLFHIQVSSCRYCGDDISTFLQDFHASLKDDNLCFICNLANEDEDEDDNEDDDEDDDYSESSI
jgi:hypothetical protein